MDRSELKMAAKEQLAGNLMTLIFMMIVVVVISVVCAMIPVVGSIISLLIGPALSMGVIRAYLKLVRGEDVSVGDAFSGMDIWGKSLWLNIQTAVFSFLWSLLLVIPGWVKSLSYSAAPYILASNPELTASEAIARSMRLMDGHKMELFVLQLSFILWGMLTVVTLGIAGFYVIPYMNATFANFYVKIGATNKDTNVNPVVEE